MVEHHVVVAEAEEPTLALDQPQHLVGGGAEAGVRAELADERLGQPFEDAPTESAAPASVPTLVVSRNSVLRFG